MKHIILMGPLGAEIINKACDGLSGNALAYAKSEMCWGLTDLAGSAKTYLGSYLKARGRAEVAIINMARKFRYVFERSEGSGGWRMELRPASKLKRIRAKMSPFAIEEEFDASAISETYPFHLRSPDAEQVRQAMRAGAAVVRMFVEKDTVTMIVSTEKLEGFSSAKPKAPNNIGVRFIDCVR